MKIGFVGLGKMGSRMVTKLIAEGHEVSVWNRSQEVLQEFKSSAISEGSEEKQKLFLCESIEELVKSLEKPRIIWMMVSHQAVDEVLDEIKKYIEPGDIVIDGGNSNYKETDRRYEEFEKEGIHFLGIGVSGGIIAITEGYPFMVGGNLKAYETIKPILDSLSKPSGGHEYFGTGGAGHFVKMVHNGIEYGMMQSLGEGFEILEKSNYGFDLSKVAKLWRKGTIISGFLVDRSSEMLDKDPILSEFAGPVARSGEGDWTLEAAKDEGLDPEIISESVEYRQRSESDNAIQNSFTAKMINALRAAFGGHKIKKPQ
jgi:6-phosphogluconate dehydrogenase